MSHKLEHTELTTLLGDVGRGRQGAEDEFFGRVYTELHRMARGVWRAAPPGHTSQPTALVHEVYVKLFGRKKIAWKNRCHFFASASRAMRDILVDQARRHGALKRGGGMYRVPLLDNHPVSIDEQASDVLALSEALEVFQKVHPDAASIVMFRFFGGLSHAEISEVVGCAEATIRRRWAFAKSWLKDRLNPEDS